MSSVATFFPPGPVSYAALRAAGVDRPALRRLLKEGRVIRLMRGVYLDLARPCPPSARAAALGLVPELGRRSPPEDVLVALDALLRCGAFAHGALLAVAARSGPGLLELAARADGRARGATESRLRLWWLETRLPTPVPGYVVAGTRLALALPEHRFAVTLAGSPRPTPGWRVLSLDAVRLLASDGAVVQAQLEREFHQHLLGRAG